MPHQCVRCGAFYDGGAKEILEGCKCGGKLFFFVKEKDMKKAEEVSLEISDDEKTQMELDAMEIAGSNIDKSCETVILDFETINMSSPGKFEIDLLSVFKKKPMVLKVGDGKYVIDIAQTLSKHDKKKDKTK